MIKAYLVDDEEHALNILALFLDKVGGVDVIGRAGNGLDAIDRLKTLDPDVVFLDIDMPEMNGLELAELLRNDKPNLNVVFVTAYDQYAVAAFEKEAVDYILKPLEMDRLAKTTSRIRQKVMKPGVHIESVVNDSGVSPLTLTLLGEIAVTNAAGTRIKWRTVKEKELLACLALGGDSRSHRDTVIECLWPEEPYQKAKVYLHTCVSYLRKNFAGFGYHDIVKYENERYFLNRGRIAVDVDRLDAELDSLKRQDKPSPEVIERMLAGYRGRLMEEEDYLWAAQKAEALDKAVVNWRLYAAASYLERGLCDRTIELAEQTLKHSPYEEEAFRLLIHVYHKLGNNAEAHAVFKRLEEQLAELGIKPSAQSLQLYGQLNRK